jgi:hypothetical protein
MSTFFHVDSTWRDRTEFANPAFFITPLEVTKDFVTSDRTVVAVKQHNEMLITNMSHSIRLHQLVLPYNMGGTIGTTFSDITPFVYVSFRNVSGMMYSDKKLINTLNNGVNYDTGVSLKDAVFVAYFEKNQGNFSYYKCHMLQTYRMDLRNAFAFRVFTNTGKTIPIMTDTTPPTPLNPLAQVNALFEVVPYAREERYDNHFVPLYSDSN